MQVPDSCTLRSINTYLTAAIRITSNTVGHFIKTADLKTEPITPNKRTVVKTELIFTTSTSLQQFTSHKSAAVVYLLTAQHNSDRFR